MNDNGGSLHSRKVKLLCNLINALSSQLRSNNVPVSLIPSVQPVALVGGEGLLKCQGPGVYSSSAVCLPHRSPIVNRGTHFSLTVALSVSVCEAKNLKLSPSNLLRLHLENLSRVSQSSTERSRAKPLLSSCGQSAGRICFIPQFFIPSSSREAEVIYRAAVASLLAGEMQSKPGGGEMSVKKKEDKRPKQME